MSDFLKFGLAAELIKSLERMNILRPTPIQEKTIPLALNGLDVLASAQTGTGKTVAYLIPLIMRLTQNKQDSALILAPTRELATQVQQALNQMIGFDSSLKSALLIGGTSMFKQFNDLKRKPRIVVGTPGRINDHLQRRSLVLNTTKFLIIDEADRMLDMGFGIQLDQIAEHLPKKRQTLLFSATFPPNIQRLSERYLQNPERVSIDETVQTAPKIQQEIIHINHAEKKSQLLKQLNDRQGSIIVFVKTKRRADLLSRELQEMGHNTEAMHGDLPQRHRDRVIRSFRSSKSRIMVATDVAARGLDIPHVMHVINYDLPECPEDYVHRIGRTGRAGAEGFALSFVSSEDRQKWKAIDRMLNPNQKNVEQKQEVQRRPFRQKKFRKRHFQKRK